MESDAPQNPGQPPEFNNPPPVPPKAPPVISPLLPARRKSGSGVIWKVLVILLAVLLVFSVALNLSHAARNLTVTKAVSASGGYGPRIEEISVRETDGYTADKILVIPVNGIIMSAPAERGEYGMVTLIKEQLRRARLDPKVRAVILKIDSPGGEVLASDEIAKAIRQFQTNSPAKPVVVSMGSLAASGGYYISAPCDWIVANELTITGSIGVIMHGYNYRALMDKIGIRPEVYKSGKFKDMLSGEKSDAEIMPEEREMVQSLINETYGKFKEVVATGRNAAYRNSHKLGKPLDPDWASYADGRILSGREALRLGFVDEIGDFDQAFIRAKDLANISKANLIEYQPVFDFANIFRMFGETRATSIKVDLGVEMPKLRPGCTYFIMPTSLP